MLQQNQFGLHSGHVSLGIHGRNCIGNYKMNSCGTTHLSPEVDVMVCLMAGVDDLVDRSLAEIYHINPNV